jgi:hypothetical protein
LLAPGGTLVVATLNYDSLVRRCFGLGWSMVGDDHFTYWNARSLRRLFESGGLRLQAASSFGVGRDFVTLLDRLPLPGGSSAASHGSRGVPQPSRHAWDCHPVVLTLERAVNRLMNATGAGVGIQATFCRP